MEKQTSDSAGKKKLPTLNIDIEADAAEFLGDPGENVSERSLILLAPVNLGLENEVSTDIFFRRAENTGYSLCTTADVLRAVSYFYKYIPQDDFIVFGMEPLVNDPVKGKYVLMFKRTGKAKFSLSLFKLPELIFAGRGFLFRTPL